MEHNPEDTKKNRFLSFWLGIAVFVSFAVAVTVLATLRLDNYDGDPSLDSGALETSRLDTLDEVRTAQSELSGYGWVDKEKGIVRVPADRGIALAVDQLKKAPAKKTEKVIPGTVTAMENFKKMQAEKAAAKAAKAAGSDAKKVKEITIKAVPNLMQYGLKTFEVTAGEPVEISFENPDVLQHNLIICAKGSKDIVGAAANAMLSNMDEAIKRAYVPDIPEVLYASELVGPNSATELDFIAPVEVGEYPYMCTFPGHWILMNGVMKVVPAKRDGKP